MCAGKACAARGRTVRSGQVCTGPDRSGHCCAVPVRRGSRRHVTVRCGPARSGAVRGSLELGRRCSSGLSRPFVAALRHASTVRGGQACTVPDRSGHSGAVPGRGGHCSTAPARSGQPRVVPRGLDVTLRPRWTACHLLLLVSAIYLSLPCASPGQEGLTALRHGGRVHSGRSSGGWMPRGGCSPGGNAIGVLALSGMGWPCPGRIFFLSGRGGFGTRGGLVLRGQARSQLWLASPVG